MGPLTSEVVLCTYNGALHVVEQLASIEAQTRRVDKVSIYDDCSNDDTLARIETFLQTLDEPRRRRFQVRVNPVNLGYAQNFAAAIGRASGDLLFLCDQDDIWERDKVEVMAGLLEHERADLVCADGSLVDAAGRGLGSDTVLGRYGLNETDMLSFGGGAFERLLRRNYVNGAACVVRRDTAQRAFPLPCDMPHDYWLAIFCALHGGVRMTPRRLYRYRQHAGNTIGMGGDGLLHRLLGIWRHPDTPRERELRIWRAVSERVRQLGHHQAELAQRKVEWLTDVVKGQRARLPRAWAIVCSALDGAYRRYSADDALLRDLMSMLR